MMKVFSALCSVMLMFSLLGCGYSEENQRSTIGTSKPPRTADSTVSTAPKDDTISNQANTGRQIQITTEEGNLIIFQLNDSKAAEDLYHQLPLTISIENFSENEKIFYPPKKLDTSNTPLAEGPSGTLAYYEPWGDVAIYYGECGGASGLYELGYAIDGYEYISEMTGEVHIDVILPSKQTPPNVTKTVKKKDKTVKSIRVTVGNKTFSATLAENTAAEAFVKLMKTAPVVINMSDYSGFEKVGALFTSLPTNNRKMTAKSGDIVLYNGNQIVIFYGSNSWRYTRLGKIDDLSGWKSALGSGDVTVTFSIK